MVYNSININKTNYHCHLNYLNIKKQTTTYDVGNPGPDLGHAQTCGRIKPGVYIPKYILQFYWGPGGPGFVNYNKGCTRLATASDKVYQLLAHGRWFSLGTLASSTTKTDRHDIAEILLKVPSGVKTQKI